MIINKIINKNIILLLTSILSAYFILFYSTTFITEKIDPNEFALGENNQEVFALYNNNPIHCMDMTDIDMCLESLTFYNKSKNILWLGNSQLHVINEKENDEKSASLMLFEKLFDKDIFLLTLSQPNANLQEHFILYEYLSKKIDIDILILPIVFDDLRETNIRENLRQILDIKKINTSIKKSKIGHKIISKINNDSNNLDNLLINTPQKKTEEFLEEKFSNYSGVWKNRDFLRVKLWQFLYNLRNKIFGINPQSIRSIIPQRYSDNILALKTILKKSKDQNIKVLLYIPPLRSDVDIPYDKFEYKKFKNDIFKISESKNIKFFNFDNTIPGKFWGFKRNKDKKELDFMHFKVEGHEILYNNIYLELEHLIK